MYNINEKIYFFYKNTDEYCTIMMWLLVSISVIISMSLLKIVDLVSQRFDMLVNVLVALATGYIISYFYFYLITLKNRIFQEKRAIELLSVFYYIFKESEIDIVYYTKRIKRIVEKNAYFENWDIIVMNMNIIREHCDVFLSKVNKSSNDVKILNETLTQRMDFIVNRFEDKSDILFAMDRIKNIRTGGTKTKGYS